MKLNLTLLKSKWQSLSKGLLLCVWLLCCTIGYGQEQNITGQVVDYLGEPIIGANVLIKGTTTGVITDAEGNFTIKAAPGDILQFSYIGYLNVEVTVKSGKPLNIQMKEDTEVLDEVVVVGFGTQKKVNLTGSVGIADSKELESRPVTNATQALQGLVPGL